MITDGATYEITACFVLVLVGAFIFFAKTGSLRYMLWFITLGVLTMATALGNTAAHSQRFPLGKLTLSSLLNYYLEVLHFDNCFTGSMDSLFKLLRCYKPSADLPQNNRLRFLNGEVGLVMSLHGLGKYC